MKRFLFVFGAVYAVVGGGLLLGAAVCTARGVGFPLGMILAILGAVFFVIGVCFLAVLYFKRRKREALLFSGEAVQAQVVQVEQNPGVQVNGRCPYRVVCRYTEGGVDYLCRSENLDNPPDLLSDTVTVYRDPRNYHRYFVDVAASSRPTVEL